MVGFQDWMERVHRGGVQLQEEDARRPRKFDSPPSAKEAGGAGTSRAQTPEWRVDRWRGRRKQPVSEACGYSHRLFRATITHLISAEHGGHWLAIGHSVPQAVAVKISRQTRVLAIWGIDIEGKALLGS